MSPGSATNVASPEKIVFFGGDDVDVDVGHGMMLLEGGYCSFLAFSIASSMVPTM